MISSRRPPTFMPATPWSQPGMTWPLPSVKRERFVAFPGGVELLAAFVEHADVVDGDGVAGLGFGAGAGDQVFGFEFRRRGAGGRRDRGLFRERAAGGRRGGLAGAVEVACSTPLDLISELSALFSLPTVMVLEPPEPQPAIRMAAPSAARRRRRASGEGGGHL